MDMFLSTVTLLPANTSTRARFSCATFTASVSAIPAATPVIWRVFCAPLPTAMAFSFAFHTGLPSVLAAFNIISYPSIPASVEATERLPRATASVTTTSASSPMAAEFFASLLVLPPLIAREFSACATLPSPTAAAFVAPLTVVPPMAAIELSALA